MTKRNRNNLILNTDSYKVSHWEQYPDGTESVFSYIESRGGPYNNTLFFGLQAFLKEYLSTPVTMRDVEEAEVVFAAHGEPFNKAGWVRLIEKRKGILPLRIRALREGTVLPGRNALVTVENTDPEFFWLTSYIETALLRGVWYPTTVATQSHSIKQLIKSFLEKTGDPAGLSFKLHDFGARGVSSKESAGLGGAAHLINFMGTDTIEGILTADEYYNSGICGFSIPAAEHSTTTILGREGEEKQYKRMLDKFAKPGSIVAIVSDAYDIFNACENIWGGSLRQQVIDSGATIVIRPDSGDPTSVVLKCVKILADKFGVTQNSKGYFVLNNVRVIQGDGINEDSIRSILNALEINNFSADNIAFGMGGALLQKVDRDTMKFAMKASAAQIDGNWVDVYKEPVTDAGKNSKKGRLTTVKNGLGEWKTIRVENVEERALSQESFVDQMRIVWENGVLLVDDNFTTIRERSNIGI